MKWLSRKQKEPKHILLMRAHQEKEQTKAQRFEASMSLAKNDDERDKLLEDYLHGRGQFRYEM